MPNALATIVTLPRRARKAAAPTRTRIYPDRDDDNWRKHTLAHGSTGASVTLDYRPVHTEPLTDEDAGGIEMKKVAPKARVY